ncbi:MAG: carboxymuconolactone decarboxylase family protein [bacterium]
MKALIADFRTAGLAPAEVAMLAFAEKVTLGAYRVTQDDIAELRGHGFSDAEVLDIALAAAARNFFSRVLDAVGAQPDPEYHDLEQDFRRALAIGRPLGELRL